MSARRQARARDVAHAVTGAGGVPRALLVGRCIEVWAEDPKDVAAPSSTMRRFSAGREWWLAHAGIDDSLDARPLIPTGSPWSATYLATAPPHAAQNEARLLERLAEARVAITDLSTLRREAKALLIAAR